MQFPKIIKNPVLLFWMKRYLQLMLFSTFFRLVSCIYFYKLFVTNGWYELWSCFTIGFVFDSSVVSVLLFLVFIISSVFASKKLLINKLIILVCFLILVFNVFNFIHLINFGVSFNYYSLKQINGTVLQTIVSKPPFYFALFGLLFCFLLIRNIVPKYVRPVFEKTWKEVVLVSAFLFLSSFLFLAFPFYYYCNISANGIINELPKNGLYCYVSSVQTTLGSSDLILDVKEMSTDEAAAIVGRQYTNINEINGGKIIRTVDPDTNFARYKRVVVVIMESMGSNAFNDSVAPYLTALKNKGVFFTKCKATGPRTQMGVSTILTGIPNVVGVNYYRRKGIYKIETLASYLAPLNYQCYYLHNGFLDYDNVDKLLLQGGFKHLIDAGSIYNYKQKNTWGVDDEALFIKAKEHMAQTANEKSFYVLQSITNHEPFELPKDFVAANAHIAKWSKKLQTYYYADCMLGKFLKDLSARPDYDSTLVFVTGDHGEAYNDNEFSYKVFHIPLLVLNGQLASKVVDADCSHMDIPYTILSACGYNKQTVMLGENLFSLKPGRTIVSTNYNTEMNVKRHDTLYRYSFEKQDERLFKLDANEMEKKEIVNATAQKAAYKKQALANYKLIRDYLLSGKINR